MTQFVTTLRRLSIDERIDGKLHDFIQLFLRWNRSINLSAARTADDLAEHVLDSLHVVPHLAGATRGVDVGAGGGFPAVIAEK